MVTRVFDTSVVAKWFLREEGSDRADRYLHELAIGASRVAEPSCLFYELAHLLAEQRRNGLGETEALSLWAALMALPFTVVHWDELLPRSLAFGFRHRVTPYDAAFVLLARDLSCDLITADRFLYDATHENCDWVRML